MTSSPEPPHAKGDLPDVSWYGTDGETVDWNQTFHSLACLLGTSGLDDPAARHVLIFMHSGGDPQNFRIPRPARGLNWRLAVDTAAASPEDVFAESVGPMLHPGELIRMDHHSMRCYIAAE